MFLSEMLALGSRSSQKPVVLWNTCDRSYSLVIVCERGIICRHALLQLQVDALSPSNFLY